MIVPLLAFGAFRSPRADRSPIRTRSRGFYVLFPSEPRGWDAKGLAIIDPETNLPPGTLVRLYYFSADMESPGEGKVANRRIPMRVANSLCHGTERGLVGTDVRMTVTALPQYESEIYGGIGAQRPPPLRQPPGVRKVLGPNFEKLVGDQVTTQGSQRILQAAHTYELAADRCSRKLEYTGNGSFRQVPVKKPQPVPTGPFPAPPFSWCPDASTVRPVEAATRSADTVAERFDVALTKHDIDTLRMLADPSVQTFAEGWRPTGSLHPQVVTVVSSGEYMPKIPPGCGSLVAIRTWGVQVATADQHTSVTYLLVLRGDGWKVWGGLPGDGR